MTEENYLKERLDTQREWYSKKSRQNKKMFMTLRMIEIVSAALIPFVSGMSYNIPWAEWIIGVLGILIAVAAASTELFKYQENWIEYRLTSELLKHERYTYLTNTEPYIVDNKFHLLVDRVESILSKQNFSWLNRAAHDEKLVNKE